MVDDQEIDPNYGNVLGEPYIYTTPITSTKVVQEKKEEEIVIDTKDNSFKL